MAKTLQESDRAGFDRFAKAGDSIPDWNKFMGYVSVKACVSDGLSDRWIIDFLGFIDLMTPWITASVVMPEVLMILLNRSNDIPFHDLHMVDVVEQLKVIAGYFLAQFDSPS